MVLIDIRLLVGKWAIWLSCCVFVTNERQFLISSLSYGHSPLHSEKPTSNVIYSTFVVHCMHPCGCEHFLCHGSEAAHFMPHITRGWRLSVIPRDVDARDEWAIRTRSYELHRRTFIRSYVPMWMWWTATTAHFLRSHNEVVPVPSIESVSDQESAGMNARMKELFNGPPVGDCCK